MTKTTLIAENWYRRQSGYSFCCTRQSLVFFFWGHVNHSLSRLGHAKFPVLPTISSSVSWFHLHVYSPVTVIVNFFFLLVNMIVNFELEDWVFLSSWLAWSFQHLGLTLSVTSLSRFLCVFITSKNI